jgi:hypothetical protein
MPKASKMKLQRKYQVLFNTKPKLLAEVLIRMAILHEFARHSHHKAEDNFPCCRKVPERGYDPFIYIRENKRLVVEL